jgi:hypothetical protein
MKTQSFFGLVAVVALTMLSFSTAYGQSGINWYGTPNGVTNGNTAPGDSTTLTLNIILGSGAELTNGQNLDVDLSSFQLDVTAAETASNYTFSSPNSALNMDNDGTDFSVTHTGNNIVRITLTNQFAQVPGDSVTLVVSNAAVRNLGSGGTLTAEGDNIGVYVASSDQPVFSRDTDTDDALASANVQALKTITLGDSIASASTWVTVIDTANGQIPADGQIVLELPGLQSATNQGGFVVSSSIDTADVVVLDDGTQLTLATVAVTNDTVVTITLNAVGVIASGSELSISLGNASNKVVTNPAIYVGATSPTYTDSSRIYNGSGNPGFVVQGLDNKASRGTIFENTAVGSEAVTVVSNTFVTDSDDGGIKLTDNTAGNTTDMTITYALGAQLTGTAYSPALVVDTLVLDLSAFSRRTDTDPLDRSSYTFSGGGNLSTDSNYFKVDTAGSYIYITMDTVTTASDTTYGTLPSNALLTLTLTDILRNGGQIADANVLVRTNTQTWATDRDETEIFPNAGGAITTLTLTDSSAGELVAIDTLIFVTNGQIPADGKIKVYAPSNFTINSNLDLKVNINKNDGTVLVARDDGQGGASGTDEVTLSYENNEAFVLTLDIGAVIADGETLKVSIGDTVGTLPVIDALNVQNLFRRNGVELTSSQWAVQNPTPANAGTYPSGGQPGVFRVEVLNGSDARLFIGDNSSTRPVEIVTNAFADSQFMFIGNESSAYITDEFPVGADTSVAGDTIGVSIKFSLGAPLIGADSLYVDLGNFNVNMSELDTLNTELIGGLFHTADNTKWDSVLTLQSGNILTLVGGFNDTLQAGTTHELKIRAQGANAAQRGGLIYNKGAGEKTVGIWTNHQNHADGKITSDSTRTVAALNQTTYSGLDVYTKIDSLAGQVSRDSIRVLFTGILPPSSKVAVTLPDGFEYTANAATSVGVLRQAGTTATPLDKSAVTIANATRVTADSLVFEIATDTLNRDPFADDTAVADTLTITIGESGTNPTEGITNIAGDSLTARVENFGGVAVRIFDASGNLISSNADSSDLSDPTSPVFGGFLPNLIKVDSQTVVSNVFAGNVTLLDAGVDGADTAGDAIDTLLIPFQIGAPFYYASSGGNVSTMTLTFKGASVPYSGSRAALTATDFYFGGDTAGVGTAGLQGFSVYAASDSTIEIELSTGDTIGGTDPGHAGTTPADVQWSDTLRIAGVLRSLGAETITTDSTGVDSIATDNLDVRIQTTVPDVYVSGAVSDTNDVSYVIAGTGATTTVAMSSSVAGATSDLAISWAAGQFHGYLPNDAIFEIILPTNQSNGNHRHEWQANASTLSSANIATAVSVASGPVTATNSWIMASGALSASAYGPNSDSTKIVIDLSPATNANTITADPDSALTITINSGLTNPTKANVADPSATDSRVSQFISGQSWPATYGMQVVLKDKNGNIISQTESTAPAVTAATGVSKQLLVVAQGQTYEPGSLDSIKTGSVRADTVDSGVDFMVIAADAYGNRDATAGAGVTYEPVTYTIPTDASGFYVISDSTTGTGVDTLRAGIAAAHVSTEGGQQPFRFLVAADGNSDVGRTGKHLISASASIWSATGNSDSISVEPRKHELGRLAVLVPGETLVPGDTANVGKASATNQDLASGGIYTINTFVVDSFYNRVDTSIAVALTDIVSTDASAEINMVSSLNAGSDSVLSAASTGLIQFTMKSGTDGVAVDNKTLTVTAVSGISGTAGFDIVGGGYDVAFANVPDSTDLSGSVISYRLRASFTGAFGSGNGWSIFAHSDSSKKFMNADPAAQGGQGGTLLADELTTGEGSGSLVNLDTTGQAENLAPHRSIYYLFATLPSLPGTQGDTVLARSDGFMVVHQPVLNTTLIALTPTADTVLNSSTSDETLDIKFKIQDFDDASTEVKVYLDTRTTLTKEDVVVTGADDGSEVLASLTNGGTNALEILSDVTLTQDDTVVTYDIVTATDTATRGEYRLYVVVNDGYDQNLYQAAGEIEIKHSPTITLDHPIAGQPVIDSKTQRELAVSWTQAGYQGDVDIDDNATIAIYYDTTTANHTTAAGLLGSATAVDLTGGFTLTEDGDDANDIYTVELDSLSSADLPITGAAYDFYAAITDTRDTVISKAAGEVIFNHSPSVQWSLNFGGSTTGSKASASSDIGPLGDNQVKINKGDVYRFNWSAWDLDQDQYLRLVVSLKDGVTQYSDLNFPNDAGKTDSWVVNSSNGEDGASVVSVLTNANTYFNWKSGAMDSLDTVADTDIDPSGTDDFRIYAFVTNNNTNPADWGGAPQANIDVFPASGLLKIIGIDANVPTPNVQVQPSVISTSANDIVTFDVNLTTNGESATAVNVVLNIPNDVMTLVDQDLTTPGIQASIRSAGMFYETATELRDTVITTGTTDQIQLQLFLSGGGTASDSTVMQFQAKAVGTSTVSSTDTDVQYGEFLDVGSNTVETSMYNGLNKLSISVPTSAIRIQSLPLARVEGNIVLQQRQDNTKQITIELRPTGSFVPITDSLFIATNDANTDVTGVQVHTDVNGRYVLTQVPSGTYNVVAKTTNYLAGQFPSMSVVPGDLATSINPTQNENVTPEDYKMLRGGDVSSQSAEGYQDNQVGLEDVLYVQKYFNVDTVTVDNGDMGDIDGDGFVEFKDLLIISENYSETGVPPIFLKDQAKDNAGATFEIVGVPDFVSVGQEFEMEVWIHNVADLRGYDFTLRYDTDMLELVEGPEGMVISDFLRSGDPSAQTSEFQLTDRKGIVFVGALLGQKQTAQGSGDLVRLTFRALQAGDRPSIRLDDIKIANSVSEITEIGTVAEVPTDYALKQNYPNPFNPVTNIRFQLPEDSRVSLKIFNILGQEVKTLVGEAMAAGFYTMRWDGTNAHGLKVASGVYIYQLKAGTFEASQKMLLLK